MYRFFDKTQLKIIRPTLNMKIKFIIFLLLFALPALTIAAQEKQNISDIILKYATSGNFAGLEELKSLNLHKDESMMLSALLEQDGKVARAIYQRFLDLYPSSKLTAISRARLMEYKSAVSETENALVPTPITKQPEELAPEVRYTLQFGSFLSQENAARFARKFPNQVQTTIVPFTDDYGQTTYKVRWKGYKTTRDEIDRFAESVPFDSFVVEYKQ